MNVTRCAQLTPFDDLHVVIRHLTVVSSKDRNVRLVDCSGRVHLGLISQMIHDGFDITEADDREYNDEERFGSPKIPQNEAAFHKTEEATALVEQHHCEWKTVKNARELLC